MTVAVFDKLEWSTLIPSMILSEAELFLYCYLLIIPISLIGIWRLNN
jgi:hypothetical protein